MSLFVGGLMDGEWHRVERRADDSLPSYWALSKREPLQLPLSYPSVHSVEFVTRRDDYKLMEFVVDGKKYHVYRHSKLAPTDAFEMILRGYVHKEIEL